MINRLFTLARTLGITFLAAALLASCSKAPNGAPGEGTAAVSPSTIQAPTAARQVCFTGTFYTRSELASQCIIAGVEPLAPPILTQADTYAVVSYHWLSTCMPAFQKDLFAHGVMASTLTGSSGWTSTFNCVSMTRAFLTFAAYQYNADAFRTPSAPPFLGIVIVTYTRDTDATYAASLPDHPTPEQHQIVLVITEIGGIWFDPQIGITSLSAAEKASISFKQA